MSRLFTLFTMLLVLCAGVYASEVDVTVKQLDSAIEQAKAGMDAEDPALEALLKTLRDTRALLKLIEEEDSRTQAYAAARANAYEEAQAIRAETEKLSSREAEPPQASVPLAELEQLIQLGKSDLAVLQGKAADISEQRDQESGRSGEIRQRLSELGAVESELKASLRVGREGAEPGSVEETRAWLASAQYAANRAEKARLDEELLSQPMRLELLAAQGDKLIQDISFLEATLSLQEERASELRQGEAEEVLAAAEVARADALGKHELVQEMADRNAVLSASLGERTTGMEDFRAREIESTAEAEQFEQQLKTIERKLEILGMTKTVGEILREQASSLPTTRTIEREIRNIAEMIGASSLRVMELQRERRDLRNLQGWVDEVLLGQPPEVVSEIKEDLTELGTNRRDLVERAIELEASYSRALTDLDFSMHRLAAAVERYRGFIAERLLWVQSRDPLSWTLFTDIPQELMETFAPGRWVPIMQWLVWDVFSRPTVLFLILAAALLIYYTPAMKSRLVATGHSVGFVRTDAFSETLKALAYTLVLMFKWPLLMFALASPLAYHEADSTLAEALYAAFTRGSFYFLGLELIRCLTLPRGLVESHFRWPAERVAELHRRVIRFEQGFMPSTIAAILFLYLYPTDVGGSLGTLAVVTVLLSMTVFFFRMPHFVQNKMEHYFVEPQTRIHSFWGRLVRGLLSWAPLVMIVAVLLGYTFTVVEFVMTLLQTIMLFTGMLLLHELGMRWLRVTRRRLRLKVQEELAQAQAQSEGQEESELNIEEEILEHDPDLLDDQGTRFLNALLLVGSALGIALIWSEVLPAFGILKSIELWQTTDSINGEDLLVQVTLADLLGALVIGVFGWIMVSRIPSLLEILARQRMDIAPGSAYAMATVTKYLLTTIIVVTVLSMLGGSWSQIQWAVAALSLGIGFGLQEIVANFFSGLIILFEQPIRVGDTVTVGETSGVVTRIQMRATTIRDFDRRELLVPNKEFVTGRLLNWSLSDPITRIHIAVGVAYGSDMDEALETVRKAALDHPLILDDPAPFVTFDDFGENALTISLRCYLEELDKRLSTASAIRLDINRSLKEAGISVAFPQRDVHIDASGPLDIRLVDAERSSPAG